jgi:anti-sigma-K factor RskA
VDIDLAAKPVLQAAAAGLYDHLHRLGVTLHFRADARVPAGLDVHAAAWRAILARAASVTCSSAAVADALRACLAGQPVTPALMVAATPVLAH